MKERIDSGKKVEWRKQLTVWVWVMLVAVVGMQGQVAPNVNIVRGLFAVEKSLNFISDGYDSFIGDLRIVKIKSNLNKSAYRNGVYYLIRDGNAQLVDLLSSASLGFRYRQELLDEMEASNSGSEDFLNNKTVSESRFEYEVYNLEIEYCELEIENLPILNLFRSHRWQPTIYKRSPPAYYILNLKVLEQ
jgi:hypothetical protein